MATKKNSNQADPESSPVPQQPIEHQPEDGGSYNRCAESGELTLVARTSHEVPPDDATIDFD